MALLENISARQTGQPRLPQVPGASPAPSIPNTTVAQPQPASAPVGRPNTAPFVGSPGPTMPSTAQPAPQPAPTPQTPSQPTQAPGAAKPGQNQQQAQPVQVDPTTGAPTMSFVMDRVPSRSELAGMPPGTSIQTPYGTVNAEGKLTLSPEGAVKYQQAIVEKTRQFGHYPGAQDPNAPKPPITLGKPFYNPFTNQWGN